MTESEDLGDELAFADEDDEPLTELDGPTPWRILLVDDEPNVHQVTKLALDDFSRWKGVELISAYSEREGRSLCATEPNIALAVIDVVMDRIQWIRPRRLHTQRVKNQALASSSELANQAKREIVQKYDINDYKSKTELILSSLHDGCRFLRSYRDLIELQRHSEELVKVNAMAQSLYKLNRVDAAASTMVDQLHETFNFSKHVFVIERRQSAPNRFRYRAESSVSSSVAPIIEEDVLLRELPA